MGATVKTCGSRSFYLTGRGACLASGPFAPESLRAEPVLATSRMRRDNAADRLSAPRNWTVTAVPPGLAELASVPWTFDPPDTGPGQWARNACREAGFEPDVRYVATDLLLQIHLAETGHAASTPRSAPSAKPSARPSARQTKAST